jgi:glycosyl transferase family 25
MTTIAETPTLMQTFIINLDRSPDRLAFMQEQMTKLNMSFERVVGVDGSSNVPAWLAPEFEGTILTSGKIGSYASHLLVAREIVARNLPYALVLEDDVTLADDIAQAAHLAAEKAPRGWDYIHLSASLKKRRALIEIDQIDERKLVMHTRLPLNTGAYVLSNAGARKRLRPRHRCRNNDMDIRFGWIDDLQVYGVFPPPAAQLDQFESDIGAYDTHMRACSPGTLSELYGLVWNVRRLGIRNIVRARIAEIANSLRKRRDGIRRVTVIATSQSPTSAIIRHKE